jgi:DNA invertase Pin-like site-specific DNA recombinase
LNKAGCRKIFEDKASGGKVDRPGLQAALDFARKGDTVLVWRLDRLGRTAGETIQLLDNLEAKGIGFLSLRDGFDPSTPSGRLQRNILASVAQFETEVRKERQLAGIAKAKTEGKRWGGRKAGTRVRLTEEKEGVIRQLHGEGKSVAFISRTVKCVQPLSRILR